MIERQKKFNIGERQFVANFPNVGQLIDMESLKQALTNNRYGVMAQSGVASMYDALDMVDAIAFLQVVVPDVARYLNIKSYAALPPERMRQFVEAYTKEIRPWYDSVMKELKNFNASDNGDAEKTE